MHESGEPVHPQTAAARPRARSPAARSALAADHPGPLARPVLGHRPPRSDALAARDPLRRRARPPDRCGATSSSDTFYTAFPEGADPEDIGARRSCSCGSTQHELRMPRARTRGWAPHGHPRLLEDLHARRLRDRAVPQADVPGARAPGGARLPVPLLDLRPVHRRHGHLRPAGRPLPQLPLEIDA